MLVKNAPPVRLERTPLLHSRPALHRVPLEMLVKNAPPPKLDKTPPLESHPALQILLELSWLVLIVLVDTAVKRPAPATSRETPGAATPIPTLLPVVIIIAGVALLPVAGNVRALTPGSNTIVPVVCIRIRSVVVEPLKSSSSCVPVPVACSAITVCA